MYIEREMCMYVCMYVLIDMNANNHFINTSKKFVTKQKPCPLSLRSRAPRKLRPLRVSDRAPQADMRAER